MIASVTPLSSSSASLLFPTSFASASAPASAAQLILGDLTGNTDDAMKTGNAIGDIIEIAARMKQEAASAGERVEVEELDVPRDKGYIFDEFDGDQPNYAVKGTITTTYDANGKRLERFVGTFQGMTDEAYRQLMIDGLKHDQSTPRNRAALAAFNNGTMREVDLADLGVKSGVVRTKDFFEDGSARSCRTEFEVSGMLQFREQHTELRDGVLYEKETGKFAAIGQNGSKFIYYTW